VLPIGFLTLAIPLRQTGLVSKIVTVRPRVNRVEAEAISDEGPTSQEAAKFYVSLFPNSRVTNVTTLHEVQSPTR
jgi:hypothetical protein